MQELFVTGYQKSGTTLLQMLLDAHPAISCPPEHYLNELWQFLDQFTTRYEGLIEAFDRRTAQQGLRYDPDTTFRAGFQAVTQSLLGQAAPAGTAVRALNDNWLWRYLPVLEALFPEAGLVAIVRDPREVAVSLYHHVNRTQNQKPSLAAACRQVAQDWPAFVRALGDRQARLAADATYILRYEDLVGAGGARVLADLVAWLGLAAHEADISAAFAAAEAQRQASSDSGEAAPGFFRTAGGATTWLEELDAELRARLEAACGPAMRQLGYPPAGAADG